MGQRWLPTHGLGGPGLAYQVLAATNLLAPNWTALGTATADANGNLQFLHPSHTNSAQRFYRLARYEATPAVVLSREANGLDRRESNAPPTRRLRGFRAFRFPGDRGRHLPALPRLKLAQLGQYSLAKE